MRRIFVLTVCLLSQLAVFSQHTIKGTISDVNGDALPGATIQVLDTYLGAVANDEGQYEIPDLKSGVYTFEVSFLGYQTKSLELAIKEDLEKSFVLESATIVADEVVVQAIKAGENAPFAQSNLDKETLKNANVAADIPYQLALTPSVVATSENGTGMGYTNMRIRGTDMTRINVTVNGVPLNDAESQTVFWVNMADFTGSVDEVQIQRGVGSSTNGAAAFGASLNFKTSGVETKPYANLATTLGSFNTFKRSIKAGSGLINNHFAFDVRYSKLDSDGWIQRGFSDHESFYFSGTYVDGKNLLKGVVLLGEERTGITWWGVPDYMMETDRTFNPAGEYTDDEGDLQYYDGQTDNYWQNHYQLHYSREFNKHLHANLTLHATTGKGYYEQYKPAFDSWGSPNAYADYGLNPVELGDSTILATDMIRQKWLDNVFYGYTATLNYTKGKVDASFGTAWNNYDGDHFGTIQWMKVNRSVPHGYEWYHNTGMKKDLSGFAKVNYAVLDNLSVYGDVQYRNISYEMAGPDDDLVALDQSHTWGFFNPKFGVTYDLNKSMRFYASYAIANREPSRADLKDATKSGGTEIPTHETLYDLELGYTMKMQNLLFNANVYLMDYTNQLVLTGKLNSVGYPVMTNVKDSYRRGIELSLAARLLKNLEWNGNVTLSQNKIQDYVEYATHYDENWNEEYIGTNLGETDISYSPNVVAANVFTYQIHKHVSASLISKYVGEQYIDNTSDETRRLDAYFVNHFKLDLDLPVKNVADLSLSFLVNNLFDLEYSNNAYGGNWYEQGTELSWMYYYPQAGRHFMLKLTADF